MRRYSIDSKINIFGIRFKISSTVLIMDQSFLQELLGRQIILKFSEKTSDKSETNDENENASEEQHIES